MYKFPKQTKCGTCEHRVKLKQHRWELWTDGATPVGAAQQTQCARCHSIVLAAIGDDEFIATIWKHYGDDAQRFH